ncbi:unnamed protein product [Candidula unifasciata]|uniref:Palmitoyltransferase n=1 Tax=Candidula unifasciata TaxID=100452 RepID=A0A8S3YLD7_9EUPU|nr:unnamed protein product [Candidula unifasciata]
MCYLLSKGEANRVRFVAWVPVVAEIVLMLWTYYVYVICLCYFSCDVPVEAGVLLMLYHSLLGLTLWCHCKSLATPPMVPPQEFHYDEAQWNKLNNEYLWIQRREEMENLRLKLGIRTIQASMGRGLLVYCQQCKVIKPDRCHHCSRCGVCVLKMDHHCPWINNCVGFHNYKYFLLFVVYCLAYCILVPLTSLRFIVAFFMDAYNGVDISGDYNRIQIIVMTVFLIITGVALLPLLKLHWSLVCTNTTTLENTRPLGLVGKAPDIRLFDMGLSENLRHIFGHRKLLWLFPVFTSVGDGCHFPLRDDFLLDKEADFNKNKDWCLADQGISLCADRGEVVLYLDSEDRNRGNTVLERVSKDKNREMTVLDGECEATNGSNHVLEKENKYTKIKVVKERNIENPNRTNNCEIPPDRTLT